MGHYKETYNTLEYNRLNKENEIILYKKRHSRNSGISFNKNMTKKRSRKAFVYTKKYIFQIKTFLLKFRFEVWIPRFYLLAIKIGILYRTHESFLFSTERVFV